MAWLIMTVVERLNAFAPEGQQPERARFRIAVKSADIRVVEERNGDGAIVVLADGRSYEVAEPFDAIMEALAEAQEVGDGDS